MGVVKKIFKVIGKILLVLLILILIFIIVSFFYQRSAQKRTGSSLKGTASFTFTMQGTIK